MRARAPHEVRKAFFKTTPGLGGYALAVQARKVKVHFANAVDEAAISDGMTRFRQALATVWRSWGQGPAATAVGDARRRIDVSLTLADGRRMLVGSLTFEEGMFVFRYSHSFKQQTDVPPIGAFPDPSEEYRSAELWPFFDVRLPPMDRADVRRVVRERKIDPEDKFHLQGELARRTVTSPYDLELRPEPAGV